MERGRISESGGIPSRGDSKRPNPNPDPDPTFGLKKCRRSTSSIDCKDRVDLADLLFTPYRHFLIRNNGKRVWVDELKGKTIVLYIVPIHEWCLNPGQTRDMVEAYHELLPLGEFEFVFVPIYLPGLTHCTANVYGAPFGRFSNPLFASQEACFNHLLSTVPFSDVEACGDRVYNTFSADTRHLSTRVGSYWVIIDPTSTVVATLAHFPGLFQLFGGAELYPLSPQRILNLQDEFFGPDECTSTSTSRRGSRNRLISEWDQLLASHTRDFVLSSNFDRVPISSLKGKVIGLYFCENVPCPPRMNVIKEAYREAKLRGYDFEIVQINFHYEFINAHPCEDADYFELQRYENVNWLTLPFKDPSCRKLQRILKCKYGQRGLREWWGDCLVIIDPRPQADGVVFEFEFSGAEIIEEYGIEVYPFTRKTLFETVYTRLIREVKLQYLFPPGFCQFTSRRRDGGFDLVNDSQLKGKRVLVLFATAYECKHSTLISALKSKYLEQAEDDNFEVVYVPTNKCDFEFEWIQDMPWLVHPHHLAFVSWFRKIFALYGEIDVAAFGIDGNLIAKHLTCLDSELEDHRFPFVPQDLRWQVQQEVGLHCLLGLYD